MLLLIRGEKKVVFRHVFLSERISDVFDRIRGHQYSLRLKRIGVQQLLDQTLRVDVEEVVETV